MLDLLITNATLPDGRTGMSVAVQDGRITEVTQGHRRRPAARDRRRRRLPAQPALRATRISTWTPRSATACRASTKAARCWKASRCGASSSRCSRPKRIIERALTYCDWAVAKGLLAIRSHVDTSDPSLLPVEALLEVKKPRGALHRPAAGRLPAGRRAAQPGRRGQPEARARHGRGRGRRHPALRAHHGRRRGQREAAVRDRRRARQAGRHALRRDRRPAVAPHRDAGLRDPAPGPAGPRQRLALHLHAQHGQLLREQADAADRREPA